MKNTFIRVKGIIKKDDTYLLVKRWVDDRIPDPFIWEFPDTEVSHGEAPDDAVLRIIHDVLSIDAKIEKIEYTWSNLLGDTHCVGIAYICSVLETDERNIILGEEYGEYEWVTKDKFDEYIENQLLLHDLKDKTL